jgi:hypothetical protein
MIPGIWAIYRLTGNRAAVVDVSGAPASGQAVEAELSQGIPNRDIPDARQSS